MTKRRRTKISGQFLWRLVEMLESPAYRALSLSAHRVLSRLELELAHHGGTSNGRLPVTYADFQAYGIDKHAIGPAIREAEALGFIKVTERGRAGIAEYRSPSQYLITYRETDRNDPTNEWREIETIEAAEALARAARKPIRKTFSSGGKRTVSVGKTHTENSLGPVGRTPTTVPVGETPTTSISRGGARNAAA